MGGGRVLKGGKQEADLGGKGRAQRLINILGQVPGEFKTVWISFKLWTCANFHDLPHSDLP